MDSIETQIRTGFCPTYVKFTVVDQTALGYCWRPKGHTGDCVIEAGPMEHPKLGLVMLKWRVKEADRP